MEDFKDKEFSERLSTFKKATQEMIATSQNSYNNKYGRYNSHIKKYTKEQVEQIIESGAIEVQQQLSRDFFDGNGLYKELILYYASLLKYTGLLIPNVAQGQKLNSDNIKKRYFNAINYVEKMDLPLFLNKCSIKVLTEGCYYGVKQKVDKNTFSVIDLPQDYCRTRFKDDKGNDIIEFNVAYFTTITSEVDRNNCLKIYPKEISRYYDRYVKGKVNSSWMYVPTDISICFPFFENNRPFFLNVIPSIIDYDESVEVEKAGQIEKIKKIIVQKIPHLQDGSLLFEPEEAQVMHDGSVRMMSQNEYVSILTTYADVDSIVSKTAAEANNDNLEKMSSNIYKQAGVSGEIFSSTSSATLTFSVKNDISIMMILANKYSKFITNTVNDLYSNSNINFKYQIYPISYQNEDKFLEMSFKLAGSGYSLILPALTLGMSQRDIISIKDLENDLLKITDKLKPPQSSYTQSAKQSSQQEQEEKKAGAPVKEDGQKSEKTEKNQQSIEKQGTVTNE